MSNLEGQPIEKSVAYLGNMIRAANKYAREHQELFKSGKDGQKPYIVLISCSDSRVPSGIYDWKWNHFFGELFKAADIGNGFAQCEAAVDYAVTNLKIPVVW